MDYPAITAGPTLISRSAFFISFGVRNSTSVLRPTRYYQFYYHLILVACDSFEIITGSYVRRIWLSLLTVENLDDIIPPLYSESGIIELVRL